MGVNNAAPPNRVFVAFSEAAQMVGTEEELADQILQGALSLYACANGAALRPRMERPWQETSHLNQPRSAVPCTLTVHDSIPTQYKADGWFRVSRSMVLDLFSPHIATAQLCIDAWDDQSRSWVVLSGLERVALGETRLLFADLRSAGFSAKTASRRERGLDPRERNSLLLILGALVEIAELKRRGASTNVKNVLNDRHIQNPDAATIRTHLKRASELLNEMTVRTRQKSK